MRRAVNAPRYMRNLDLHDDFGMETIASYMREASRRYFDKAQHHSNQLISKSCVYVRKSDFAPVIRRPRDVLGDPDDPITVAVKRATDRSNSETMENFEFSKENNASAAIPFYGPQFYKTFKDAEFLTITENVITILSKSHELRLNMKNVAPGKMYKVIGMTLFKRPLLVKKSGGSVKVEGFEFTFNRLMGFTAAYAYENRHLFPELDASEPKDLGLTWSNQDDNKCKLYLSAISGSEHFIGQFEYWPLICALRKYQLKKLPVHLVVKAAKIKNDNGETMAGLLKQNFKVVRRIWKQFPKSTPNDLIALIAELPTEWKELFIEV